MRLTPAAETLVREGRSILASIEAADAQARDVDGMASGQLAVATFPSAGSTLVAPALTSLRKQHAGLQIRLLDAEPDESLAALRAGEVDLAVIYQYGFAPPVAPDLALTPLREDQMRLCPPRGTRHWGHAQIELADLAGTPFVAGRAGTQCHAFTPAASKQAGFEADITFETDDIAFTCALVEAGLAAAIMAETLLKTAPVAIHTATPLPLLPPRKIFVAHRPSATGREPIAATLSALMTHNGSTATW